MCGGHVISRYHPSLIQNCKNAIRWSEELANEYLSGSMFQRELASDPVATKATIEGIIQLLTNQELTRSHTRHIPTPVCKSSGLKIIEMEEDHDLQDDILSIHHASVLTIMNTDAIKIIENQNGQAYISRYSNR